MPTGTIAIVVSVGGVTIKETVNETGDNPSTYGDDNTEIALAAGKAASSWVKTDADTAACNLTAGHGYVTGKADVYWTAGRRYDVDMTVTVNALALDGGVGDDFPASAAEDVVICTPQQINTAIDGDNLKILAMDSTVRSNVYFEDAAGDSIGTMSLTANLPYLYYSSLGTTSPLTGDPVTKCFASNGTTTAGVLTILVLQDSTP